MAIVALSIEPFAAARKLPAQMAKELGLTLFDLAPFERHVAERLFTNSRNELVDFSPAVTERQWSMTVAEFAARLRELALETALQGDVLIHGWTAASILGGLPHIATVRLHASALHRTRVVQKYRKYPLLPCAAMDLASEDSLTARFVTSVLDEAWCPRAPADLVIDMEHISDGCCMALVAEFITQPHYTVSAEAEAEVNERLLELR